MKKYFVLKQVNGFSKAGMGSLCTRGKPVILAPGGQEKWDDLYQLFKDNNLNNWNGINWPPFNGAKSITNTETGSQIAEKVFDRFQTGDGAENLNGRFASPVNGNEDVGDLVYTYDSRALANQIEEGTYYFKFKINGDIPSDLSFEYGEAIPWFKLPGEAVQIKSSIPFNRLGNNIEIIEILKYHSSSWIKIK